MEPPELAARSQPILARQVGPKGFVSRCGAEGNRLFEQVSDTVT
jgi:hypothetical protein